MARFYSIMGVAIPKDHPFWKTLSGSVSRQWLRSPGGKNK
jgi:hypothetical protein